MADAHRHPPSPVPRRLLLASRSPRRALMLREAGFAFEQFDPPYQDPADPSQAAVPLHVAEGEPVPGVSGAVGTSHPDEAHQQARALAAHLAQQKALSVPAASIPPGAVLLAADTLGLDPGGNLMGTPEDAAAAGAMLRGLVGRTHLIVTAVALRCADEPLRVITDAATVTLGDVDAAGLEAYLAGQTWRGKAGGYNLVERRAAGWPITVEGDPTTVMGLPMSLLVPALASLGVFPAHNP